jgi:hypothetical protein
MLNHYNKRIFIRDNMAKKKTNDRLLTVAKAMVKAAKDVCYHPNKSKHYIGCPVELWTELEQAIKEIEEKKE